MPNPPPGRREAGLPWWQTLSLLCAGCLAVLLHRRITGPSPSQTPRRTGGGRPPHNDAAAHLTTSW
ncbi:hypothetical protein AVW11_34895 [Streptomyces amritsarensis]|uniref:Uncharacterized protein n=1 Tax=Streptomyces amritsarensis TaxID=681158 RepID=A0ABX3FSJ6_9ACTN|nr:hypothetical protein [Streptomyces amritsarensis]OLZ44599.1 hypothetical protein AVW11_34895 [Streptomyces amritsarensis]